MSRVPLDQRWVPCAMVALSVELPVTVLELVRARLAAWADRSAAHSEVPAGGTDPAFRFFMRTSSLASGAGDMVRSMLCPLVCCFSLIAATRLFSAENLPQQQGDDSFEVEPPL